MIVALSGRRIDPPGAEPARFPLAMRDTVRRRIRALLIEREAAALVCSAACGADLLALDAAGGLGLRRHVVLPFPPERFRDTSVTARPGDWGPLFDRIIEAADKAGDSIVLDQDPDEPETAYTAAMYALLDEADRLAETGQNDRLAVAVWDGLPREGADMTAAFLKEARLRGFDTAEVSTR